MFEVKNRRTGKVIGTYNTKQAARRAVDRKDNEYGGYVHSINEINA